jgi:quercetin dioxygenase-like cupin family protein
MKAYNLIDNLQYENQEHPHAEPLFVSDVGRVLRFTFKAGQRIPVADAPSSPIFYIILDGEALFADESGNIQRYGPNMMVAYEPGEKFEVMAGDEGALVIAVMRETHMARRESARGEGMS